MTRALTVALILIVAASPATAEELQVWNAVFAQGRPAPEGVTGWFDAHVRRRDGSSVVILRPAVGYVFGPSLVAHAGYAFIPTVIDDAPDQTEHRIWQQVIWSPALSESTKLQGRLRVEQRFGPGDELGHRLRGFVRGQWAPSASSTLQLVAWDEGFVQLNDTDWGPTAGFDQNRLFVGVGADTAARGVRVELGYLNVYLHVADQVDHVVMINVSVNIVPVG